MGIIIALLYPYTFTIMIGDGIWKHRNKYYEKNKCPTCGHFVEPKND